MTHLNLNAGDIIMITDKKYTKDEFLNRLQELGKTLAARIPHSEINISSDPLSMNSNHFVVRISDRTGAAGKFGLMLLNDGSVESYRIIGD